MKKLLAVVILLFSVGVCTNYSYASPVDLTMFSRYPAEFEIGVPNNNIIVSNNTITINEDANYGYAGLYFANDNFYVPQNATSLTFNYSFTLNTGDSDYIVAIVNFNNYDFNLGYNNASGITPANLSGSGLIDLTAYQNQIISLAFGLEYNNIFDQAFTSKAVFSNIEINSTPVPLPGAIWLFSSGLVCIAGFIKRSRKS